MGAWEVGAALVKALTYAATLGAAGLGFFCLYATPLGFPARELRRALLVLAGAGVLLSVLKAPLLAGALNGVAGLRDVTTLHRVIMSAEGKAGVLRAAGLTALCAGLACSRGQRALLGTGAVLAASSFAALGHVHARHQPVLSGLLMLHLVCAAFWIGALWPLARVLARDPQRAQPIVARFSRLALAAVTLLAVAGVSLLVALLGTPSALGSSRYGRWLCLKLALFGALLAVAARNKLRLSARLHTPGVSALLIRSIRLEMALAAGVLAVTSLATTLTGPGD